MSPPQSSGQVSACLRRQNSRLTGHGKETSAAAVDVRKVAPMQLQWILEGFHPETEELVQEYPLPRVDADAIRRILNVPVDIPIEPFSFDVPDANAAHALAKFADENATIDPAINYQLGCYRAEP